MSVCPLLTSAIAVFRISCWFLIVHLVKICIYLPHKQREWDSWAHKPGLTYLSLVHSPLWYCVSLSIAIVHDYTLCFTGSPCCSVSYYTYISVWPYYIVIHLTPMAWGTGLLRHYLYPIIVCNYIAYPSTLLTCFMWYLNICLESLELRNLLTDRGISSQVKKQMWTMIIVYTYA